MSIDYKGLMDKVYYVYIMANKRNGTLYVGVSSDLEARVWSHKNKIYDGFTKRYEIQKLVYYELHEDIYEAIWREKRIKKWNRSWKLKLIEKLNPNWEDLCYKFSDG